MAREHHWTRHYADAQFCRELSVQAEADSKTIRSNFWRRIERECVQDAQTARERQIQPPAWVKR